MLRRQQQIRNHIQRLLDAALFAVGFWIAHVLRSNHALLGEFGLFLFGAFGGTREIEPFEDFLPFFLLTIPLSLVLLQAQGFYSRPLLASRRLTAWQLLKVCFLSTVALIMGVFLAKVQLARSVFILFGLVSFCLVFVKEEMLRRYLVNALGEARLKRRIILVGTPEDLVEAKLDLCLDDAKDIDVVADLDINGVDVAALVEQLHTHSANGVLLATKHTFFGHIEKVIQACELEGVEVWMLANFFNTQISRTTLDELYGRPVVIFRSTPDFAWQAVGKQTIDFLGALFAVLLFSPILVFCSIAIRLSSKGPVFFRQQRSGLNGRPFTMYKFRTMITDAEQRKDELMAYNEMAGPVFKVTNDPRITPIGKFLRKRSFDELPQLFNVLRGEMSLVGPRPLPVDETMQFDELAHRRRLSVKPGLTCLWQISGRNKVTDFKEWVRLDLEYIDNWSLWLDIKILFQTIPVVLGGDGAK
jgi:exopolysaccharide biosynthesis polyprenyl glycosylphosphotransferase